MAWKKAPDALKALMEKAMAGIEAEKRTLFGFPCWFVRGNMFAGSIASMRLTVQQASLCSECGFASWSDGGRI